MPELKTTYKIIKEQNLIIVVYKGILTFNTIIDFIETLNKDPEFNNKLNQLVDLNNVIFKLSSEDIYNYVLHLENNAKIFGKKRIALITNTPNQVTYSTIYKLAKEELQPLQSIQIFSTIKKAYDFLRIKKPTFIEVSEILKMLNNNLEN